MHPTAEASTIPSPWIRAEDRIAGILRERTNGPVRQRIAGEIDRLTREAAPIFLFVIMPRVPGRRRAGTGELPGKKAVAMKIAQLAPQLLLRSVVGVVM